MDENPNDRIHNYEWPIGWVGVGILIVFFGLFVTGCSPVSSSVDKNSFHKSGAPEEASLGDLLSQRGETVISNAKFMRATEENAPDFVSKLKTSIEESKISEFIDNGILLLNLDLDPSQVHVVFDMDWAAIEELRDSEAKVTLSRSHRAPNAYLLIRNDTWSPDDLDALEAIHLEFDPSSFGNRLNP